jgi:hypothetical protein
MIALCVADLEGKCYVVSLDHEGNKQAIVPIFYPALSQGLAWIPNSSWVIYYSNYLAQFYIIDFSTKSVRPLAFDIAEQWEGYLLTDGRMLLRSRGRGYYIDIHNTNTQITEIALPLNIIDVSPDGTRVLYVEGNITEANELRIASIRRPYEPQIMSGLRDEDIELETMLWSPDQKNIACIRNYTELSILSLDGTQQNYVGDVSYFWRQYNWSPDSQYILFVDAHKPKEEETPTSPNEELDFNAFYSDSLIEEVDTSGTFPTSGDVYLFDLAALERRFLFTIQRYATLDGITGGEWRWTSDSRIVLYTTYEAPYTNLWSFNIETGAQHVMLAQCFSAIYSIAVA